MSTSTFEPVVPGTPVRVVFEVVGDGWTKWEKLLVDFSTRRSKREMTRENAQTFKTVNVTKCTHRVCLSFRIFASVEHTYEFIPTSLCTESLLYTILPNKNNDYEAFFVQPSINQLSSFIWEHQSSEFTRQHIYQIKMTTIR